MDFEELIKNAETLTECVGLIALSDDVRSVEAVRFNTPAPFGYVRVKAEYVNDELERVETTFDIEPNPKANWGNDEPMFIITDCE